MKAHFKWSKTSTVILSGFILTLFLIGYVWWPLLAEYISQVSPEIPLWRQIDWLLIGNFLVMSILITLNANLRHDIPYGLIALFGGFIIEAWGTRSGLWTYYTYETPPLWIVPAWPIAALSVNRLFRFAKTSTTTLPERWFQWAYWLLFGIFFIFLMDFAWIALIHPLTIFALTLCAWIILTCKDKRSAVLIMILGSMLGYFLERWGTTRLCWAYHTGGTPPWITVAAHGMASVAIWQAYHTFLWILKRIDANWVKTILPEENL